MGMFDGSIGAFVIGTVLSTFLLGVTSCQAYNYFVNFPRDKRLYWWLIVFLCAMDWAHTAVSVYTIYLWGVDYFADPMKLVNCPWSFAIDPAMTGVVALVCQLFYAYRCFVVGKKSPYLPIFICVLSVLSAAFAVACTVFIFQLQQFSRFQEKTFAVSIWLGAAALCDIIITATLVYHLNKSKAGVLATNSVLSRLIENVISTNGLTAAVALIDAVLFGALTTSYHVTANLCLVKLYFNSLLVSLNARAELERQLHGGSSGGGPRSNDINYRQTRSNGSLPAPTQNSKNYTTALGFTSADCANLGKDVPRSPVQVRVHTTQTTTTETAYEKGSHSKALDSVDDIPFDPRTPDGSPEVTRGGFQGHGAPMTPPPHPYAMAPLDLTLTQEEQLDHANGGIPLRPRVIFPEA